MDERFTVEHPFRTSRQVLGQTVLDTDGLAHHTHRERLRPLFSAKALAGYRTGILEPAATALLDRLCLEPSGDLMAKYARLFPARVILQMLGLPLASERAVLEMLRPIIRSIDGHPGVLARAERSRHALEAILRAAFRSGEVAGSPLATYVLAASGWDEEYAVRTMLLLLAAGTETTTGAVGGALTFVLTDPGLRQRLADDPGAIKGVVREALRLCPPLHYVVRYAREPVCLDGVEITPGLPVQLCIASANRDETLCERSEVWDPGRPRVLGLEFGAGAHLCAGATLAIEEITTAVGALVERLPRVRLTEYPRFAGRVFRMPARLTASLS